MRRIEFDSTNNEGNYATHGYFRYFGKLPPVVIRYILNKGIQNDKDGPIVDLMCGCGTSLVEAMIIGRPSIGVDVNPIAALISKVKTTFIEEDILRSELDGIKARLRLLSNNKASRLIPEFRNIDYWFDLESQIELAELKYATSKIEDTKCRNFFTVTFLSIIRRVSNASPRAGRIFHVQHERPVSAKEAFFDKANEMITKMRELRRLAKCTDVDVLCDDARHTTLAEDSAALVIVHPPYFALYKYSSDVLRFELEWLGVDRKRIATREVSDGFKTTDISVYYNYIEDVGRVLLEAARILKPRHQVCLIVNNSTFRDDRLPVVEDIHRHLSNHSPRLRLFDCLERGVRFQQASYHRSGRPDKITSQDYLVFFQKTV
ncbi:MAG: hypothetical protein WBH01_02770 [Dehalococcoidia bacterium]